MQKVRRGEQNGRETSPASAQGGMRKGSRSRTESEKNTFLPSWRLMEEEGYDRSPKGRQRHTWRQMILVPQMAAVSMI